jgi:sterol desaturase/sphingolipid hydroxylase (fatty acid hydroxylase superfamily)
MLASYVASFPWTEAYLPLIVAGVVTVGAALRYVVIAGGALGLVTLFSAPLQRLRIQKVPFTQAQLAREFWYSMSTALIFGVIAGVIVAIGGGIASARGAWWPSSVGEWALSALLVPVMLLLHDFYFYWMHRLIHVSWIYPHVHRVHHLSTNPSALAAFAFHPLEAVLEAVGVIAIVALVPMPVPTLIGFGFFAFALNVLGHTGYEFVPARFLASPIGRWLNSSTSHNHHHRTFVKNFGLYTLIWDRLCGTIDPRYDAAMAAAAKPSTKGDLSCSVTP